MFDSLGNKLQDILKRLKSRGKLSEDIIQEALKEIKLALLEADVNLKVVKSFIERIKQRAIGQEVLKSITPGQQVVKIVYDEMVLLLGEEENKTIQYDISLPHIILLAGLQGSGKTTSSAKLASLFKKQKKISLLVAADVYRPAAITQLEYLAKQIGVDFFKGKDGDSPLFICQKALEYAKKINISTVIIDTAGRLHIDEKLMQELCTIKEQIKPQETLLVVDAMTGQDAVNIANSFNQKLGIDGMILTKMDGDARGGAALSIKTVTGKPINFVGRGEKIDCLEVFHPDRIASRILGMGDIVSLVEKAQEEYDLEKAADLEKKILKDTFTLEDFKEQLQQIKKMGPISQLLELIPGFSKFKNIKEAQPDEGHLKKIEAMINSMTPAERRDYTIIGSSRKKRIARGSGTTIYDINQLIKQFALMKKMFKQINKPGKFLNFPRGVMGL
ncbi:MAG: signal recognition particle protein [bacterium]